MILDKIIKYKKEEQDQRKRKFSLKDIRFKAEDAEPARDFLGTLKSPHPPFNKGGQGGISIIAEVKKVSPSAGIICKNFDPIRIAQGYEENGASAISVLTDEHFFQGSLDHLEQIHRFAKLPLLRKDFTIAPYHLYEARASQADAILLIVRILEDSQLKDFIDLSRELGMAALVEVHSEDEMERAARAEGILIGINNRDLDTLKTDIATTIRLAPLAPKKTHLVGESGLSTPQDLQKLVSHGVSTFLIGESLLRSPSPGDALASLIKGFDKA